MMEKQLFVVLLLWLRILITAGQFGGGGLDFGGNTVYTTPASTVSTTTQSSDELKKEDFIKPWVLSAQAIEEMGEKTFERLIRQIVETKSGSHQFGVDPDYTPDQLLSQDKHLYDETLPAFKDTAPGQGYRKKRAAFPEGDWKTWPNKEIPYTAESMTDETFISWIHAAVDMFNKKTCVKWVDRELQVPLQTQYVDFQGNKQLCGAYVGMRQNNQISPIYLYEHGTMCRAYYVVVHEMLHVMGSHHEMSRPSRYHNIDIDWNCVRNSSRDNYLLQPGVDTGSYDLESIMQYSPSLFRHCVTEGKLNNKTMRAKDHRLDFLMYKVIHEPSHYDIQEISRAYKCDEGCIDNCQNGGFVTTTVYNPECHCACPKYFSGEDCTERYNADKCGSHTELVENVPVEVKSDGYDAGFYSSNLECIYLFTSPVGTRIKLDFLDLRITTSGGEIPTCKHHLECRVNLNGQDGPEECGTTNNLTYVTSINAESHMAVLNLNTLQPGSPSKGFLLQATAFRSECVELDPCQNGGTCTDVEGVYGYHFHCECPDGLSGDICTEVTAEATATCDMETGLNKGICFMNEDRSQSSGYMRFYEYRPTTPKFSYTYIYVKSPENSLSGSATLASSVVLEPAYRCLYYYLAIVPYTYQGVTTKLEVSYASDTQTEPVIIQSVSDTSSRWRLMKVTLPLDDNVKIFLKVTKPSYNGFIALNNLELKPGACDVCDSSPCLNNGGCEPAENDNGFTCSCLLGYSGYTCQDYVCDSSPCLNNGECEPAENGFTCNCISGYSGDTCQDHICDSSPCQNGGICDPNFESPYYICSCVEGYHGSHCEIHVCDSSPCKNGGSCHAAGQTYRCDCLYGTEGEDCSVVMTTYCSFDDTCMLSNSPHVNCQWETRQGSSPTLYTGPRRAYSGQNYVYVDSTKYKGKRCQFEMREHFDDRQRCIILFYVMNGASVGALSVSKEVSGASSTLFTSSGNKGNMWRNQLIDVHTDSAANTTIRIEAMTKPAGQWGDIAIDEFQLRPYPCSDIVMCTFESGLPDESSVTTSCVKLHRGVDYYSNWRVRERPTQQNGPYPFIRTTGPLKSRSGYRYAFVDSSYNVDAVMEVRHTFTGEACLSFAYHMFGADIGTLFVFLDNVEIWSLSGEQGDEWHFVEIGIEFITNKKIIFTTDPGGYPGDSGDIALDDIMVVNRSCELV